MKKVKAILVGAGARGMGAYASYALKNPHELEFVAVAEPDKERRDKFQKLHNLPDDMCFSDWKELLSKPKLADAALICTQDRMHFEPTIMAIEKGYHILLEKPISPDPRECLIIEEKAREHNIVLSVCHVLRYTSFFTTIKKLLDDGKIGRLISIQHNENVGYWHQAHSFVRGNWRNSKESSPMILQKSCHDTDILLWLVGAECVNVSSFGSLTHFKSECAPKGAPKRCLDGCPAADECPFYAPKIYLTEDTGWPTSVISMDTSIEARTKALQEGPYGRCVYHCDNDVVDHQVVNMEFSNEVTVAFTMCAFSNKINRTIKLMGTRGEIRGDMHKNEIEITDFNTGNVETIQLQESKSGHGGGDYGIMRDFIKLVLQDGKVQGLTSASVSVQSHMIAFAAEKARLEKKVVNMKDYVEELKSGK